MVKRYTFLASAAALLLPNIAAAQTLSQVFGLFNILSGIMLVAGFLTTGGGFVVYLVRIGNNNRVDGIQIMMWGVTILFVLIVLLAIVQLVQYFLPQ
jgi:hypothetical protein